MGHYRKHDFPSGRTHKTPPLGSLVLKRPDFIHNIIHIAHFHIFYNYVNLLIFNMLNDTKLWIK